MSETEIAEKVREAAKALNAACQEAARAGLRVRVRECGHEDHVVQIDGKSVWVGSAAVEVKVSREL